MNQEKTKQQLPSANSGDQKPAKPNENRPEKTESLEGVLPLPEKANNFKNLTGLKFNFFTVLGPGKRSRRGAFQWRCKCVCGNFRDLGTGEIKGRRVYSCGCKKRELKALRLRTHGMTGHRAYGIWRAMIQRCEYLKAKSFRRYGGRGIVVCEKWRNSFLDFLKDMGIPPKGLSLHRVNNNGNYEPGNCVWADDKTQCLSKSNNHLITFNGETKTITEWANEIGVKTRTMFARIRCGIPIEIALTVPDGGKNGRLLKMAIEEFKNK